MEQVYTTIILCGGKINYTSLPINTNQSNAMIPVNGKPVISWILDDLIQKGITDHVVVVVRDQDHRLQSFLQRVYMSRIEMKISSLTRDADTILHSLNAGLTDSDEDADAVRVILGDTLIQDSFVSEDDFVYVGEVEDSQRWCITILDLAQNITDYFDKQEVSSRPLSALAGYYHFQDKSQLRLCVNQCIQEGKSELSSALKYYGNTRPLKAKPARNWFDFGNLDRLVSARHRLLRPRHFNALTIDPVLNTITKVSAKSEKLQDELDWYLSLPEELKVLTPRIIRNNVEDGTLRIVQEYYGYPTLSELYVYGDLRLDTWLSILRHLLRIHAVFLKYRGTLAVDDFRTIYATKYEDRLQQLRDASDFWQYLLHCETLTINQTLYRNIPQIQMKLLEYADHLAHNGSATIIHGDLCFSNILFDINNQIVRLIDPRGSFGRKGIWGDPRYDIAKLRHSISGLYDFILADMFTVTQLSQNDFFLQIYSNEITSTVGDHFDLMIEECGYNLEEIRFIEGLLFTSMVPLHSDQPNRQIAMYLVGVISLNEVLGCA